MRSVRHLEQTSDRTSRELDIRSNLRDWDNRYPEIHHELIVRWLCGAAVSIVATTFYNSLRRGYGHSASSPEPRSSFGGGRRY